MAEYSSKTSDVWQWLVNREKGHSKQTRGNKLAKEPYHCYKSPSDSRALVQARICCIVKEV
eukprot:2081385-Amphidinium_carterae.1